MNKYFKDYGDILFYALTKLDDEDNVCILCDIDTMTEIKDLIDFDDYTEVKTYMDNDCEVYYISKFENDNGYSLFIEPAVYEWKLLGIDATSLLVMDYIEEDYKLNGEYEEVEFLRLDEEDFEDDEDELNGCDYCIMEQFEEINDKLDRVIELLDKPTVITNISKLEISDGVDAEAFIKSIKALPEITKQYTRIR